MDTPAGSAVHQRLRASVVKGDSDPVGSQRPPLPGEGLARRMPFSCLTMATLAAGVFVCVVAAVILISVDRPASGGVGWPLFPGTQLNPRLSPIFKMPLMCNARNTRPLTPRPAEYDPDTFEVVVGIISIDNVGHAGLRQAQRDTWFQYTDVSKPSNGFGGRMRVEYVFGRSFENNFTFSDALYRESKEHGNVLAVDLKEPKRVVKPLLTAGQYGVVPDVLTSLKAMAFFCYAEQTYRRAKFIAKADDDEFLRVPLVVRTAATLPSYGVLWGQVIHSKSGGADEEGSFCSIWGVWYGMSRDVLHLLNSLPEVQQYTALEVVYGDDGGLRSGNGTIIPFDWLFHNTTLHVEDAIPGAALTHFELFSTLPKELGMPYEMKFYHEPVCRIHNLPTDPTWEGFQYFPNPMSMLIHHVNATQQQQYMKLFPEGMEGAAGRRYRFACTRMSKCLGAKVVQNSVCNHQDAKVRL